MKIIIPMAGWGSRLRPHTLKIPKPMLLIAGKPIVERLVEGLSATITEPIEEIHFIIRKDFGEAVENKLMDIAKKANTIGKIAYQETPEGTAHAIYCAKESLAGHVLVAFADTLFTTNFKIDTKQDGVIWVSKIDDPRQFGVIKLNQDNIITDFVEKPQEFVSDLAIIGIYFFNNGEKLANEIKYLLDNNLREKGEFQLTTALENLRNKGSKFVPGEVSEWLDCGNKDACVNTNQRILEINKDKEKLLFTTQFENSIIIEPCYIAENVIIKNSVIGPHVSIGENTKIENAVVKNCIIQANNDINGRVLYNSMLGLNVKLINQSEDLSLGDYCIL